MKTLKTTRRQRRHYDDYGLFRLLLIKAAIALVPMYFDNQMLKTALDSMDKSLELQENPQCRFVTRNGC